jgi:hypothetical protein
VEVVRLRMVDMRAVADGVDELLVSLLGSGAVGFPCFIPFDISINQSIFHDHLCLASQSQSLSFLLLY